MDEWKEALLADIAEIEMGQSPKGETCNSDGDGVPLLNGPTEFGVKSPLAVQFTTDSRRECLPFDILFCVRGSTTGRMNWADKIYSIGRGLAAIRHKAGVEYRHFLKGLLDHKLDLLLASATGSTFPNVTRNQIEGIEIKLPPLPEQKSIASTLSSLDDKIDLLHRQNATLEKIAETLFRKLFVEDLKEDWETSRLGEIIDFNPSYKLIKGEAAPYLEMSNVRSTAFSPENWYDRSFTSGMKFQNGDTLLARITPCLENGKTCFVSFLEDKEIGWGSTEFIVMRMNAPFHPFLSYIIARDQDFRDFAIASMSGSSGRQRAQAEVLKEYEITIPPIEKIGDLNHQLGGMLEKMNINSKQIRTLTSLRDSLLPKLMSGEVRVQN